MELKEYCSAMSTELTTWKGRVNDVVRKLDLIVIGSRLTGVSRFLIGGIADKVVDYGPCPVMVVKIPE